MTQSLQQLLTLLLLGIASVSVSQAQSDSAFFNVGNSRIEENSSSQALQLRLLDQPHIRLAAVSTQELAGSPEQRLGAASGLAHVQGRGLSFQGQLNIPELTPYIHRELPMLWEVRVPPGRHLGNSQEPVQVQWQPDNRSATSRAAVGQLRATPWIQQRRTERDGWEVLTGGVRLQVPLEMLEAGAINGRLLIDLRVF